MSAKAKTLAAIAVLGLIDAVVPLLPVLALILVYVVLERPAWFSDLYAQIFTPSRPD